MLKRMLACICFLLMLSACATATRENYDVMLNSWVGKSERELVLIWGVPDKQYDLDAGTRLLSYVSRRSVYYPGSYPICSGRGSIDPIWGCSDGFTPHISFLSCETTFTLVSGKVAQWRHEGNNCRM